MAKLPDDATSAMFEGLFCTTYCPRGHDDCDSLHQLIAHEHASFICCGEKVAAPGDARDAQDKYRVCFKNDVIDDMQDYDKRDITHTAAVLLGALAIIENRDSDEYDSRVQAEEKTAT